MSDPVIVMLRADNQRLRSEVERLSGKTGFCSQCETYAKELESYKFQTKHAVNIWKSKAEAYGECLDKIIWYVNVGIAREGSSESKVRILGEAKSVLSKFSEGSRP